MIIIAFEGADRTGKETQSKFFTEFLNSSGKKAIRVEIPYDDNITHKMIYKLLKSRVINWMPSAFQLIQMTNKFLFQFFKYQELNNQGYDYLIFDRWKMSAEVYGLVTRASSYTWKLSNKILINPDLTIILMGKPLKKKGIDQYEKNTDLQRLVRERYSLLAHEEKEHYSGNHGAVEIVDVSGKTREQVQAEIFQKIKSRIPDVFDFINMKD